MEVAVADRHQHHTPQPLRLRPAARLGVRQIIRMRRHLIVGFIALTIVVIVGIASGIVGISYPAFVDNTDLRSPVLVTQLNRNQMVLSDMRTVQLPGYSDAELTKLLKQIETSKYKVDIDGTGNHSEVWIYGDVQMKICGTPWAQPIMIPLIPNRIRKNQRILIAVGTSTLIK